MGKATDIYLMIGVFLVISVGGGMGLSFLHQDCNMKSDLILIFRRIKSNSDYSYEVNIDNND